MSILKDYAQSGKPSAAEQKVLQQMIARRDASKNAASALDTSHAFLRIERVAVETPITLFGNPAPSKIHNRISIHTAPEAPALVSVLMTDTELSGMMMSMNRARDAEMTLETVAGQRVNLDDVVNRNPFDVMMSNVIDRQGPQMRKSAEKFRETITAVKRPLSKTDKEDLFRVAQNGFVLQEFDFYAKIYTEASAKRATVLRSEATALLKNGHLLSEPEADPEAGRDPQNIIEMSPLLARTDVERAVWARAYAHQMITLAAELNIPDYNVRDDLSGARIIRELSYNDPRKDEVKSWGHGLQMNMSERSTSLDRDEVTFRDPRHLIGEMSEINGEMDLHSDAGVSNRYIAFRMNSAIEVHRFGERKLQQSGRIPFFEIYISPMDLMSAVRGNPDGDAWTRCTLRSAFGEHIEFTPYVHPLNEMISQRKVEAPAAFAAQMKAARALAKEIDDTGMKTAADRARVVEMTEALLKSAPQANAEITDALRLMMSDIGDKIEEELAQDLRKMMGGRTAQALAKMHGDVALPAPE